MGGELIDCVADVLSLGDSEVAKNPPDPLLQFPPVGFHVEPRGLGSLAWTCSSSMSLKRPD